MEPFRIITTPEELAGLTIGTIVSPIRQPGLAYRKAWSNLFTTLESPKERDNRETWTARPTADSATPSPRTYDGAPPEKGRQPQAHHGTVTIRPWRGAAGRGLMASV